MASSKAGVHEELSRPTSSDFPHSPQITTNFTENNPKRSGKDIKELPSDQLSYSANHDRENRAGSPSSQATSPEHGLVQVQTVPFAAKPPTGHNDISIILCTVWVFLGVSFMLAGTSVVHRFLLPHIYRCPDGATCHHNLDPGGNIIPRLQTLMQYWLQAGTFLAGLGLSKLIACDARLVLKRRDDVTITAVERSVLAVDGQLKEAILHIPLAQSLYRGVCRLFSRSDENLGSRIQHGTSLVGILALSQIAVGLFISFVVGFSIPDLQSAIIVNVPFSYPSNFTLPRADVRFPSIDERVVGGVLDNWLIIPNSTRRQSTVFDGSLAVQDNRTVLAIDSRAGGSHITGAISCGRDGWNASVLPLDSDYLADGHAALPPGAKAYNISGAVTWAVTYSYTSLASVSVTFDQPSISNSVLSRQYLWASNTANGIPNATASADNGIFYALCNHTIFMDSPPVASELNVQAINPSVPMIFSDTNDPYNEPCISSDPLVCVSWSVDRIVEFWWEINIVNFDLIPFSCQAGMLVAFDGLSDTTNCTLNNDRWLKTLNMTLSALISAAPLSGNVTQDLSVSTEAVNKDRWWIQAILPGTIFLIYLACLAYTWHLTDSDSGLQELDLPEIVMNQDQLTVDANDVRNTKVTVE